MSQSRVEGEGIKLQLAEKKEQNVETIRRLVMREAFLIDEEKKWVIAQRDKIRSLNRSKSPHCRDASQRAASIGPH